MLLQFLCLFSSTSNVQDVGSTIFVCIWVKGSEPRPGAALLRTIKSYVNRAAAASDFLPAVCLVALACTALLIEFICKRYRWASIRSCVDRRLFRLRRLLSCRPRMSCRTCDTRIERGSVCSVEAESFFVLLSTKTDITRGATACFLSWNRFSYYWRSILGRTSVPSDNYFPVFAALFALPTVVSK